MVELRYDSRGHWRATDAAMMADNATLVRRLGPPVPEPGLAFLMPTRYPDGVECKAGDYLDWQGRDYRDDFTGLFPRYGDVIYVREHEGWTQFWMFYLYNDKSMLGLGLHEGDWEMVQTHRDGRCVFGQHRYGRRAEWRNVIYVAAGSQASYPAPGRHRAPVTPDLADGKGSHVQPEVRPVGDWALWPGRWGSSKASNPAESWSPESPSRQRRWRDPEWFWRIALP